MAMASAQKTAGVSSSIEPTTTPLSTTSASVIAETEPTRPSEEHSDLIAMNSPSPAKSKPPCEDQASENGGVSKTLNGGGAFGMSAKQRLEFEEQLLKKESRMAELERLITESAERTETFRAECAKRKESEEQMKQVNATETMSYVIHNNINHNSSLPNLFIIGIERIREDDIGTDSGKGEGESTTRRGAITSRRRARSGSRRPKKCRNGVCRCAPKI